MRRFSLIAFSLTAFVSCGEDNPRPDIGPRDSGRMDTGFLVDAGSPDDTGSQTAETGVNLDATSADSGPLDAMITDHGSPVDAGPPVGTRIQLLSLSDWHGQLDPLPPASGSTISIGGAAVLATYFARERAEIAETLLVTAGDAFGGTPPVASLFEERPAVEVLGALGLAVDTFGNHNFDRGLTHLQQMIDLSTYPYVSSNLGNLAANLTGVESPFHMETLGGVKVAFIGITNSDAPTLTFPGRMGTLTVNDPVSSAMAARNAAASAGAQVFVALVHMGATTSGPTPTGPLLDFATAVNGFHVVFGDHTDIEVNQVINGAVVLENRSKGRTYGRVRLDVEGTQVSVVSADLVTPLGVGSIVPDTTIAAIIEPYRAQLATQLDVQIGTATGKFPRGNNVERLGEAAIGNLVTDAMRDRYGVQLAIMNGGGIRAPLPSSYAPASTALRREAAPYVVGPPYDLVLGDAYTIQPFGNTIVTRTVTGAQVWALLEHGVSAMPAANGRFTQVSGLRYTYTASNAAGARVISVTLDSGAAINNDSTTYTLAVTDFVNHGGDGYTMLADDTGTSRELDAVVLAEYIRKLGSVAPSIQGRVTRLMGPAGTDAGPSDSGRPDSGGDSGFADGGFADARPDATVDGGFPDARPDATADGGSPDARPDAAVDGGFPDAAAVDSGVDGGVSTPVRPGFPGDLIITEIMKDPTSVTDAAGEWFEIHNPTTLRFDLIGCDLYDLGSDVYTFATSFVIEPGQYATLASSAAPGFTPDFVYSGFQLANADDEVVISCPATGGSVDVDFVLYDNGPTFPDLVGASMFLGSEATDVDLNDDGANWCAAVAIYNGTDKGSPGAANPNCR
ncbi:MAG: 5'-nucleotidase C-terminal domain-containing protein [Deltaproteobacteria bacterium]|nr:5'-nucleotidase C-terminal domain-containing protein [Deltaproteobacteria bacterium]